MVLPWPPKNSDEMLALQEVYGRDIDIAVALGVSCRSVEELRRTFNLPTVNRDPSPRFTARKNLRETKLAELYAGQRYR